MPAQCLNKVQKMATGTSSYSSEKMTSSILVATLVLCISLVFANDWNSLEETHGTRGLNYQKYSSNNRLGKAIDQLQKLELEIATETTRLEELNKLKESEGISESTSPLQLTKLQTDILKDINKTEKKIQRLNAKYPSSKTLVENLKSAPTVHVNNQGQIFDRTKKLMKALEEQEKLKIKLAVEEAKLKELENQKESEAIDESSILTLTKWQKNILQDISKTNKNIVELTIDAAVIKTEIEQLRKQLSAVGGSPDGIALIPNYENQILNERIHKEEKNQMEIAKKLAKTTDKLSKLETSKEINQINNISPSYLTKKQKKLLKEIDELKNTQHDLTTKAAVENVIIEELKSQM